MKDEELDRLLKETLQDNVHSSVTDVENEPSTRLINKELIIRWIIIGSFTLAAIAVVYMTSGADSIAEMIQTAVLKVSDWIKSMF